MIDITIIYRDTLTLIDLLISPETKFLVYLVRVTTYFEKNGLDELALSCDLFIRQLNSYSKSKTNTNANISINDKEKLKVLIYKTHYNEVYWNNSNGVHTESIITGVSNHNEYMTAESVKNNLAVFLKDLNRELKIIKSIPLNTSIITKSIDNILSNFHTFKMFFFTLF